jgi:hypothetical protein
MRSVVDRNVVMRCIPVQCILLGQFIDKYAAMKLCLLLEALIHLFLISVLEVRNTNMLVL